MKKIHLIILIFILIIGGYLILKPKDINPEDFTPEELIKEYKESEDENYIVEVDLEKTGLDILDQEIQKEVLKHANGIRQTGIELKQVESSAIAEMVVEGRAYYFSNDIRSYRLSMYQFTGGAHGNTEYLTWTYSIEGDKYSLKDVLKPESRPLSKIYPIVLEQLKENLENVDEAWIEKGSGIDNWDNYTKFNIDSQNLYILFPAYQVAPYSEGIQEIIIPLEDIGDILLK